jgi:hypothetical protein
MTYLVNNELIVKVDLIDFDFCKLYKSLFDSFKYEVFSYFDIIDCISYGFINSSVGSYVAPDVFFNSSDVDKIISVLEEMKIIESVPTDKDHAEFRLVKNDYLLYGWIQFIDAGF